MKRTYLSISALLFLAVTQLSAQNDADAIRISQYYQTGTARATAMGGAFGALGGDLTAVSINPAGLGIYRKGEFQITPLVYYDKTNSDYFGQSYEDFKYKFRIGSMGFVSTIGNNRDKGWVSASFALSYNRLADFNRISSISARNTTSSILDEFCYYSDGVDPADLNNNYEGLAYDANLIWDNLDADNYRVYSNDMYKYDDVTDTWNKLVPYNIQQDRTISTKGGIDEYTAAFGTNLSNTLYLGMSLGFNHLYYDETILHTETDQNNGIDNLQSFDFNQYYTSWGNGFVMKMGAILRPVDALRIGASIHMPTFYSLQSEFSTAMDSYFDGTSPLDPSYHKSSVLTTAEYQVITPWRTNLGLGVILGKSGIISFDYERVDYTTARIKGDLIRYDDENKNIQDYYKTGNNLRLGGELKLGIAALRGGYALYGSPFKSDEINSDARTKVLSAGFGIKTGNFYFDMAYSLASRSMYHVLYYSPWEPNNDGGEGFDRTALLDQKTTRVVATFGFKF